MTFKEELEVILKKLLEVIIELKEISLEKTDSIMSNNIEKLEEFTKREEDLINRMGIIENSRMQLLDTWGVGKDTSISDIIEKLPEDNSELIIIKNQTRKVFEELGIRNKLNNDLIRENLDWIDFNMNLITSTPAEPHYGDEKGKAKGKSIFDRKV